MGSRSPSRSSCSRSHLSWSKISSTEYRTRELAMFARAAIVGRVARERSEARRNYVQQKKEIKKRTPQAPLRQRCFIPLLKGPCITVASGCCLMIIGAIMCNFAFHANTLSQKTVRSSTGNGTHAEIVKNNSKYEALRSLTFIGPSLMGLGIFMIIIACVLLLDKRDKIIKGYVDNLLRAQQEISMELSYRAVTCSLKEKSSNSTRSKIKCEYSESHEKKVTNSSRRTSRKISQSSAQVQGVHNVMQDISESEIPPNQEIELSTLEDNLIRAALPKTLQNSISDINNEAESSHCEETKLLGTLEVDTV